MSENAIPQVDIDGHSVGRLFIGTNWFLGYSHQSSARSNWIKRYQTPEKIASVLAVCTAGGMNAIVGPMSDILTESLKIHEGETGRHITYFITPGGATTDELLGNIDACAQLGAEFCLPHTSWTDSRLHIVNTEITDYPRVAAHIRDRGMSPGLSTHRPEVIVVGDKAGYDIATYIQPYNALGFLCPVETDWIANVIRRTEKPVIIIKPFAAGRLNPITGMTFVFNTIKDTDVCCIGLLCEEEAAEDLEIARQLFEQQKVQVELQYTRSKAALVDDGE
jgi:hypothetical protein